MDTGGTGERRGFRHYGFCSGDNRHMPHMEFVLFLLQPQANTDCADDEQRATKRVRPEFLL